MNPREGTAQALSTTRLLAWSAAVTLLIYMVPGSLGYYLSYPLLLLSTIAHEMGHGVAAMLCGADFESLHMYADASGVARWSGEVSRLGQAFIAAAGLVGPAFVAMVGFMAARRASSARLFAGLVSALLVLAAVFVVRSPFGLVFIPGVALTLGLIAWKGSPNWLQFSVAFVASQLALSVFSRADYLFTDIAHTAAGTVPSDVAQIANLLVLPYWFWGLSCGAVSLLALVVGIWGPDRILRGLFRRKSKAPASK